MKLKKLKGRPGFTLVEILIVIFIIGLLSTFAVIIFSNSKSKARDNQRFSDINLLQEAVEFYMEDNGTAPDPIQETWADLESILGSYMQADVLPVDLKASDGYLYVYCHSGYNYLLAAVMENNQEITNDIDGAHGYTVASECIFSGVDTNVLNCTDTAGGGDISGVSGSVFCLGFPKGT